MKKFVLSLSLLSATLGALYTNAASATSVSDFPVQCKASLEVLSTFGAHYSPGMPPKGRFGGIDPSAGFSAKVKFIQADSGCVDLNTKYQLDLFAQPIEVHFSTSPQSLSASEIDAKAHVGKVVPVSFKTHFDYVGNDGELQLADFFIEQWISMSGDTDRIYQSFKVDSLKAHGIPTLSQMTDSRKLKLAETIVEMSFVSVKKPGWAISYPFLVAALEPKSMEAKESYLKTLVSLFEGLNPDKTGGPAFFYFYVGGSMGEGIAKAIIGLARKTESLTGSEIESLAFQFPALLLIGQVSYNLKHERYGCFPISNAQLSNVLNAWLGAPKLNYQQTANAKSVATAISGKMGSISSCLNEAKTDPSLVKKATELYAQLSK